MLIVIDVSFWVRWFEVMVMLWMDSVLSLLNCVGIGAVK